MSLRWRRLTKYVQDVVAESRVELAGWAAGDFLGGLIVVCHGALHWLRSERDPHVIEAGRKLRCFAVTVSVISFAVLGILWVVSKVLMWLVTTVVTILGFTWLSGWLQFVFEAMAFKYVFFMVAFLVPQCTLLFIRYWSQSHQDRVFVAALKVKQALPAEGAARLNDLADALEILPQESTWLWLKRCLANGLSGWFMAIVVLALSCVQGIGPVIYQIALGARRRKAIGNIPTMALLALAMFPQTRVLAAYGLQVALMARAVSKELFYTYLGRCSRAQQHAIRGRHSAYAMGFGFAAGVLLSIPVVGSLLWFDLVHMAGLIFGNIVVAEEQQVFDLKPAVERFREEEARRREEDQRRALEREMRSQRLIEDRAAMAQESGPRRRHKMDEKS